MNRVKNIYSFSSAFLFTAALIALSTFSAFRYFAVPVMDPTFADLRLITSASECLQNSTWSMNSDSCDPWNRPFNYPSLWVLIFSIFSFTEANTYVLGTLEIILLGLTLWYWLRRVIIFDPESRIWSYILLFFVFAFSPPVLLLAERGNVDILMFAGLTLAAEVMRCKYYLIAGFIVALLGTLKIYPFVGIFIPFLALSHWPKRLWILFVSLLGGLIIVDELSLISDRSMTAWNSISYGMNLIPLITFQKFQTTGSRELAAFFGVFLFVGVSVFLWKLLYRNIKEVSEKIRLSDEFNTDFQLFALVFIFSYLVGTSYDYRLVISFPLFLILRYMVISKKGGILLVGVLIGVMYGGQLLSGFGPIGILLVSLSDTLILVSTSLLFLILGHLNFHKIAGKKE
jgi:hypothetical protein